MEHEKLVEQVAQQVVRYDPNGFVEPEAIARSILSLVADALGEPTQRMIDLGHACDPLACDVEESEKTIYPAIWAAMLAASPLHPQGDSQKPKDDV